jgi:hypothetical protein
MPASLPKAPSMDEKPLPAFRDLGGQTLRGRLPSLGRVHRRDPHTGAWVGVDEPAQVAADMDVESDDDEFAAQLRDARSQIAKEEAALRRLARAAMTDPKVRAEVEDIESRLRSAQQVLKYPDLVRQEDARLEAERLAAEDEKRRVAARAAAAKLLARRVEVMRRFDEAARELAEALAKCESLSVELDRSLQQAGEHPGAGMLGPHAYENAVRSALGNAGVRPGMIAFEGAPSAPFGPLAGPEPAES